MVMRSRMQGSVENLLSKTVHKLAKRRFKEYNVRASCQDIILTGSARVGTDAHRNTTLCRVTVLWCLVEVRAHDQAIRYLDICGNLGAQTDNRVGDFATGLDHAAITNHGFVHLAAL